MSLSMSLSVSFSVSLSVSVSLPVSLSVCQIKCGAMNISFRHDNYLVDSQGGRTRWRRNLKGLSHERVWVKSAEHLEASPLRETYRLIPLSAKSISLHSPLKPIACSRGVFLFPHLLIKDPPLQARSPAHVVLSFATASSLCTGGQGACGFN
jgi:hypothetical protein